ncbi:uncharacterized protein LAESUDRAFT_414496 [Laetiporus sulphureus 93-53]|uniref:Uncharacterized protein n=1 Tax=Laetiporus sulphureus 93-53 TaxID=1314785 RepID=A0A165C802_9APHY|nr:uncharacterized protein LAESUDRAFT_414496 [Laetiporus sulphureus 93-53]KZT02362.1 hypothetical protein LAESUDRAFT_414496 [Laetiporus sulphureus 93-53]
MGPVKFESASDLFNNSLTALIWVAASKDVLPKNCIRHAVHTRDGSSTYVARAFYQGGLHPGKGIDTQCWISYDGKEIWKENNFELLTGHSAAVKWVHVRGAFDPVLLGDSVPVQAGYEANGEHLYVAQAHFGKGVSWQCGKVKLGSPAMIPCFGKEHLFQEYLVMVYG